MTGRDGGPGTGGNVWEFLGSRVDMLLVQEGKRGEIPPIFTAPSARKGKLSRNNVNVARRYTENG
ncbi:uncharacterized protein RAG0_01950 [Rhynchosporium agropyri]|uniref:Uncharacterized protein n=1 Tax=Rhynchosporium agropyri TaxID=914238 RepID=A0A1E1K3W3_9HELO|nr:uncharacterized protein RAG0_01950 [Rhynchosporium agropyri]